jgi:hypothetical protein
MTNQSIQMFHITPDELANLINQEIKKELSELKDSINRNDLQNPHLTRRETAKYFDISLNCVNDWVRKGILKPYKVGQRTFFKRSELLQVMFNRKSA